MGRTACKDFSLKLTLLIVMFDSNNFITTVVEPSLQGGVWYTSCRLIIWYTDYCGNFAKLLVMLLKLQSVQFVFLAALVYIIPIIVAIFNYFQFPAILMLFKILAAAQRTPLSSYVTQVFW